MMMPLSDMIQEARHTIRERELTYPDDVAAGRMRQAVADERLERMRHILELLEDHEATLGENWIERRHGIEPP